MRNKLPLVLAALMGAAILAAPMLSIAADDAMRLGSSPGRITFVPPAAGGPVTGQIDVDLSGTQAANVAVVVSDVVPLADGHWADASLGSTDWSLKDRVTVEPNAYSYVPDGSTHRLRLTVTVTDAPANATLAGSIEVVMTPVVDAAQGQVTVVPGLSIATKVVVAPAGSPPSAGSGPLPVVSASLAAGGISVSRAEPWTLIDALIPDVIPNVLDHGPAKTSATYTSTGNAVLDTQTVFEYAAVGPQAMVGGDSDPGHTFYRLTDQPQYALPGQAITDTTNTIAPINGGGSVDSLPFIGFVRVTTTTTGTLGPLSAEPIVQSTVFVIFPWKELLALVLLLGVLRVLRGGWRRMRRRGAPATPATPAATRGSESTLTSSSDTWRGAE